MTTSTLELYGHVQPEIIVSLLTHQIIHASNDRGIEESRFLLKDWLVNLFASYYWRQRSTVADVNNSTCTVNAFVSRGFFDNRLLVRWSINNLLGQNLGVSQTNAANVTTFSSTNIIGRYWLFTVAYRFEHGLKKK